MVMKGCDASIMIVNPTGDDEWRSPDDQTLKREGFETVMNAKAAVDSDPRCRFRVSCADILALAARDSVALVSNHSCLFVVWCVSDRMVLSSLTVSVSRRAEGPTSRWSWAGTTAGCPLGEASCSRIARSTSTSSTASSPASACRRPTWSRSQVRAGTRDCANGSCASLTAGAGAHTIGAASCSFFQYRLSGADPAMNPALASQLRGSCPGPGAFLDAATPVRFDNQYYRNLRAGWGLLGSDQVLHTDARSREAVERYAADERAFFDDFAAAMTRLGRVGVRTAANGEIRRDCRFPNWSE
jgi:peroxidase